MCDSLNASPRQPRDATEPSNRSGVSTVGGTVARRTSGAGRLPLDRAGCHVPREFANFLSNRPIPRRSGVHRIEVRGRLVRVGRRHATARLVRAEGSMRKRRCCSATATAEILPIEPIFSKYFINALAYATLILDYRGYGRSEGKPNEAGVLADARAARRWLAHREKIADTDVVLMGESLGGAVAVDLAACDGAAALVLESTFTNLPDVAAYHYPWLPVRWAMRARFDSAAKIANYHGPLLQSHGDADTIVPLQLGKRLFDAANSPKKFVLLPGHDHNDSRPPEYYDRLANFLDHIHDHATQ